MVKKPFFTPEFYTNPFLTKNVINELLNLSLPVTFDYHFSKGCPVDHLTFDWRVETVRIELSKLISDPEGYLQFQKETHWDPEEDEMPLNALLIEFSQFYYGFIYWGDTSTKVKVSRHYKIRKEVSNG